jgi:Na+-driven multidrug efflux pump
MAFFGANDSSMFFLMPILSFVTIKFVMLRFGEFYLPILTIIYSIFEITVIFEATGEAMRPIMPIYYGDRNYTGIMWILNYSTIINLRRAVGFSVLLLVAAP